MAVTTIGDLVTLAIFAPYIQLLSSEMSAFRSSGVLVESPLVNGLLSGGSSLMNVPHFRDLADTESNVSTDNPASEATPEEILTGQEIAIRHNRNQVWSTMDLTDAMSTTDPADAIARQVAAYWVRQENRMLIAACEGVMLDNVNDSDDMLKDITLGGAGTPAAGNLFSAEAVIDAQQTMGDSQGALGVIAMHSVIYSRAKKNNLIDFIPDARGEVDIPFFLNLRVVVDDQLPANANSGNFDYSTYLFGAGAFARGETPARVPAEISREALQGDGGGQEFLHSRVQWVHHPRGFSWISGSMAVESPTNTELALAANWNRVYNDRNQVKFAELRTNG